MSSLSYPTVLHEIDGPSVLQNQIINIAPGEGNIPVSFSSEPSWEAFFFQRNTHLAKVISVRPEKSL